MFIRRTGRRRFAASQRTTPSKRMAETGQFTVHLMQPDAFEVGSRFIPAAQKVRLLHASIRHRLARENR
jgi:hypothetical protein